MEIVVDFDGTCVSHEFPLVGKDIGAEEVLKKLVKNGHKLILFTMRSNKINVSTSHPSIHNKSGQYLQDAINWFKKRDIPLYGIQTNPTQQQWTSSPKAYGQLYIDDAGISCPLIFDKTISERPFVDWKKVEEELIRRCIIKP